MSEQKKESFDYAFYNRFQNDFYKNINNFKNYSNYDINQNSYMLINGIAKGYPHLAMDVLGIYGSVIKFNECPDLIRALQYRFVNGFVSNNMNHVYFKQSKNKPNLPHSNKTRKRRRKKDDVIAVDFEPKIIEKIMQKLFIDRLDYEEIKYNKTIQNIGHELTKNSL